MTLRCKGCHGTVWLQADQVAAPPESVSCPGCGQRYQLGAVRKFLAKGDRLANHARQLAKHNGIDLPGAYSVLLGIMTTAEVMELGDAGSPACQSTGRTERDSEDSDTRFDRAFQDAIDSGHMTPAIAKQRGRRDGYAAALMHRHKLPEKVAYSVTDNRISLLEAIRRYQVKQDTAPVELAVKASKPRRVVFGVAAAAALVALAWAGLHQAPKKTSARLQTTEVGQALVRTDAEGRVFQVRGPDPSSVLEAYCKGGRRPCRTIRVTTASSDHARARLGLLVDPAAPDDLRAISIYEDRETNRWIAGNVTEPLEHEEAPHGARHAARGALERTTRQ